MIINHYINKSALPPMRRVNIGTCQGWPGSCRCEGPRPPGPTSPGSARTPLYPLHHQQRDDQAQFLISKKISRNRTEHRNVSFKDGDV